MSKDQIHYLGIRHHGPGSARSLVGALASIEPDTVLIEGPPDANALIPLAADNEMRPPVALLVHQTDAPARAVFYPFAEFSPEWQALRFALARRLPVEFIDLPQALRLAPEPASDRDAEAPDVEAPGVDLPIRHDPLNHLAEIAGYDDGERWWEAQFEEQSGIAAFAAVAELMAALRADLERDHPAPRLERLREAHMRRAIRQAARESRRIAVITGAWHVPALAAGDAREDEILLRDLRRLPTAATWIPWTYDRLARASGYGAGIGSPAYYQHLWSSPEGDRVPRWIAGAARLLRSEDIDSSTAGIIEAVRLAEALAGLRGRATTGLSEMLEAVRSVLCHGGDTPVALVRDRLIVGRGIGAVPDHVPSVPLQVDLRLAQRRLRLPPEAGERQLELDLRKPFDLDRSRLLHRLRLLDIPWGQIERARGQGTFREVWRLVWAPELAVRVVERARFGNTVASAAEAYLAEAFADVAAVGPLASAIGALLPADLPDTLAFCIGRLSAVAATTGDVGQLMGALPPLTSALRYGDVRRTDAAALGAVVEAVVVRIAIGLGPACAALDDDAALDMARAIDRTDAAVAVLSTEAWRDAWFDSLRGVADRTDVHGRVAGRAVRRLADADRLDGAELRGRWGLGVAPAGDPHRAASWVEGFLEGGGAHLLHDDRLWSMLDGWLGSLREDAFRQLLPLLRRTFATFPRGERRLLGERAARRTGPRTAAPALSETGVDPARADLVTPVLAQILDLPEAEIRGEGTAP